jgi:hypothetical protein
MQALETLVLFCDISFFLARGDGPDMGICQGGIIEREYGQVQADGDVVEDIPYVMFNAEPCGLVAYAACSSRVQCLEFRSAYIEELVRQMQQRILELQANERDRQSFELQANEKDRQCFELIMNVTGAPDGEDRVYLCPSLCDTFASTFDEVLNQLGLEIDLNEGIEMHVRVCESDASGSEAG